MLTLVLKIIKDILNLKLVINVTISGCKKIFAKRYNPNWPVEVSVIKKVKNANPWTYVPEGVSKK